jgi:hypothetical protein
LSIEGLAMNIERVKLSFVPGLEVEFTDRDRAIERVLEWSEKTYTVFPCGAVVVDSHKVIVSYGAADSMVGFGEIDLTELLSLLDKGRIY